MIDQRNGFSIRRAWIVTRREIRDTMRDWRLVAPIAFLTIVFPALMQITADAAQRWAIRWGGEIIGERLMPFLAQTVMPGWLAGIMISGAIARRSDCEGVNIVSYLLTAPGGDGPPPPSVPKTRWDISRSKK